MSSELKIFTDSLPYTSLQLSVSFFGIIGNVTVILVILILREYQKSVTHWYVLQLAIADLLFLVTVPFSAVETLSNSWPFPEWMCKIKEAILFLNYYSSVFLLMIMSIDRYIAICHAFSEVPQILRKRASALIITLIIWIISAFLCIPIIMAVFKSGIMPECKCQYDFKVFLPINNECSRNGSCDTNIIRNQCYDLTIKPESDNNVSLIYESSGSYDYSYYNYSYPDISNEEVIPGILATNCHYIDEPIGFSVFLGFNFAAMFLMPLFMMIICYGLIIRRLSIHQKTAAVAESIRKRSVSIGSSRNVRKRVTVMCATLVFCFVICWLPYHAVHLAKIKGIDGEMSSVCTKMSQLGSLLAYLNSALNPFLYGFLGTNFKKRLQSAGKLFFTSNSGRHSSSSIFPPARSSQKLRRERHNSNTANGPKFELARLQNCDTSRPSSISKPKPLKINFEAFNCL